jgi:hypothetical protein
MLAGPPTRNLENGQNQPPIKVIQGKSSQIKVKKNQNARMRHSGGIKPDDSRNTAARFAALPPLVVPKAEFATLYGILALQGGVVYGFFLKVCI